MKKFLLLALLLSTTFAQYTTEDYELIKTTYLREFNKEIINNYLDSKDDQKVIPGLLSVSHSNDTSFVEKIVSLNFDKYGNYIAFALGQIGYSDTSIKYLLEKISMGEENPFIEDCYEAIGKIGNKTTFEKLFNNLSYIVNPDYPLAATNIFTRIEIIDTQKVFLPLAMFLNDEDEYLFNSLFALYRLGGYLPTYDFMCEILYDHKHHNRDIINYTLGNLRRIQKFPKSTKIIKELVAHEDWTVRTEAAKAICYTEFSQEIKNEYLKLLFDPNPNVSKQTAISIRNIKQKDIIKEKLDKFLYKDLLTDNALGELIVSYSALFSDETLFHLDSLDEKLNLEFKIQAFDNSLHSPEELLKKYISFFEEANEREVLNLLFALNELRGELEDDSQITETYLKYLNSENSAAVTLLSTSVDSIFVEENKGRIQKIITNQVEDKKNDPEFMEPLQHIAILAEKISPEFYNNTLKTLTYSDIYAIKTFAENKLENKEQSTKSIDKLNDIWKDAFAYSRAKVKTNKGEFTIDFSPQWSPLSVGNFINLAKQKYFENVIFHRVVPNFVIQTGDPSGTGWGGPGYEITSEFSMQPYDEAYVGMASAGKDTEGSQWFVMHSTFPHLNGRYSNFGKVIYGMDVVNSIDQYDNILSIELVE